MVATSDIMMYKYHFKTTVAHLVLDGYALCNKIREIYVILKCRWYCNQILESSKIQLAPLPFCDKQKQSTNETTIV